MTTSYSKPAARLAIGTAINLGKGNLTLLAGGAVLANRYDQRRWPGAARPGPYALAAAMMDTLAAKTTGEVEFADVDGLAVGKVNATIGISTTDDDVTLRFQTLTIDQAIASAKATWNFLPRSPAKQRPRSPRPDSPRMGPASCAGDGRERCRPAGRRQHGQRLAFRDSDDLEDRHGGRDRGHLQQPGGDARHGRQSSHRASDRHAAPAASP